MKPPEHIDGARVIAWAWSDVPFGVVQYEDGGRAVVVHGLAVCQYEGSTQIYRFSCNASWECEQDQTYESVVLAKSELPEQYRGVEALWQSAA
jgi:hypothetical protein